MFLAISAILISCISLYVAFVQGDLSRKMLAASSWPLLRYETGNVADDGKPTINMDIRNEGVGTAVVDSFRVFYRGKEEASPYSLLEDCCGYRVKSIDPTAATRGAPATNLIQQSVIRSGDRKVYLTIDLTDGNKDVWRRLDQVRFQIKFEGCYCSVLGDCWRSDLITTHPHPVKTCELLKRS